MPEFFFHLVVEIVASPKDTYTRDRGNPLLWTAIVESLSPFLTNRADSESRKRPTTSPHTLLEPQKQQANVRPASSLRMVPPGSQDKRLDRIYIEGTNMVTAIQNGAAETKTKETDNQVGKGIGTSLSGLQTKGLYVPLDQGTTDGAWGIVHLYRDAAETTGLYGGPRLNRPTDPWLSGVPKESQGLVDRPPAHENCTTLCILAVPSYLAPSDFLGFVGEGTRNEVSHFRMIRTARANRYMVLMKFRHGKMAKQWQQEWNGKVFNSMEVGNTSSLISLTPG